MRTRPRSVFCLAIIAILVGGCAEDYTPVNIKLIKVLAKDLCVDQLSGASLTEELAKSQYKLRLTFMEHGDALNARSQRRFKLVCYRIIDPNDELDFLVPEPTSPLVMRVEAFASDGALAFSGQSHAIDLKQETVKVFVHATDAQSCSYQSRRVRAFHSATLLPNGEVLMIGGLMGSAQGATKLGEEVFANASVDAFDPSKLSWKIISGELPELARAFHRAVLLPSPAQGPYKILILGGLAATDAKAPLVARLLQPGGSYGCKESGECRYHFLFVPHAASKTGEAGIVTYTPDTDRVEFQPLDTIKPSPFPTTALGGDGTQLLLVGGSGAYVSADAASQGFAPGEWGAEWIELRPDEPPAVAGVALTRLRAGHAVARIDEARFLVLGGNMDGTESEVQSQLAESGVFNGSFGAASAPSGEGTAWHTLSEVGLTDAEMFEGKSPDLLWAGGLRLATGDTAYFRYATDAAQKPLQRVTLLGSQLTVENVTEGGFKATGYHSAVRLHDGSVLLSGGNPGRGTSCQLPAKKCSQGDTCDGGAPCGSDNTCPPKTQETIYCPDQQLAVYGLVGAAIKRVLRENMPQQLKIRRYGHRSTRLLDNTVLVSGGIGIDEDGSAKLLVDAEIYNPVTGTIDSAPAWMTREDHLVASGMTTNNVDAGACLSKSEYDERVSSIKIAASPVLRTSKLRLIRLIRSRPVRAR